MKGNPSHNVKLGAHHENPTEKKDFHNLVVNQCPSVSGKSTLTYHVGIDEDNRLYLRVADNSAGGLFSKEWIALAEIENILGKLVGPFTSHALRGLFRGKSNNTPAFLLAVMLKEGLAVRSKAPCVRLVVASKIL